MMKIFRCPAIVIGGCLVPLLVGVNVGATAQTARPAPEKSMAAQTVAPTPEKSAAELNGYPQEVSRFDTKRIDFVSKVNGHAYSIEVALPEAPPPPDGYPVIYVFDGYYFFLSFAEAAIVNAQKTIVVGLGYPRDPSWVAHNLGPAAAAMAKTNPGRAFLAAAGKARYYDLSPPTDDEQLKQVNSGSQRILTKDDVGGGYEYLKIIETEVKPRIYALAKVNKDNQALFGHSLGGLAVIEALFTEPHAFHTFIASSASIWWGNRLIMAKESDFAAQMKEGSVAPRVLITVGSEEQSPKDLPEKTRAIDNACELAGRLKALHGAKGYEVADCVVFKDLDHGASPWAAIGRAFIFAFPH